MARGRCFVVMLALAKARGTARPGHPVRYSCSGERKWNASGDETAVPDRVARSSRIGANLSSCHDRARPDPYQRTGERAIFGLKLAPMRSSRAPTLRKGRHDGWG